MKFEEYVRTCPRWVSPAGQKNDLGKLHAEAFYAAFDKAFGLRPL